jgi:hypothetical protein
MYIQNLSPSGPSVRSYIIYPVCENTPHDLHIASSLQRQRRKAKENLPACLGHSAAALLLWCWV